MLEADGNAQPALDGLPAIICVPRARLVVAGRGSIKCDLEAARAFAECYPAVTRVEVSTVRLLENGTEVLGPWRPDLER